MKSFFIAIFLVFCGCVSRHQEEPPSGAHVIASLLVTTGAFSGPLRYKEGWVFYEINDPRLKAPMIRGYQFHKGRIVNVTLGGAPSAALLLEIRGIGLKPFDWDEEITRSRERFQRTLGKDDAYVEPFALDGAEWEITIATEKGLFRMKKWNPGPLMDFYAAYSENISKLKRFIDALALSEGHQSLGL